VEEQQQLARLRGAFAEAKARTAAAEAAVRFQGP
jgi:hypothetical protein